MPSSYTVTEGAGARVIFGTTGISLQLKSITPPAASRAEIAGTHLGSTVATAVPGKLITYGNMTVVADWEPNLPSMISKVAETVSIQYPPGPGQTVGKTKSYAGSWVMSETVSELTHGSPLTVTYEIKINADPTEVMGY